MSATGTVDGGASELLARARPGPVAVRGIVIDPDASAVVFDFFGTLACRSDGVSSGYAEVFARHGYHLDPQIEAMHFATYVGVEHTEHSVDRAAYERWVRWRHLQLTRTCQVAPGDVDSMVDAMRVLDESPVVAYPDAAPTLVALRERGLRVGICSNWGWELDPFVAEAELLDLVDATVTSARVGARKPHPRIYREIVDALGVPPAATVFVGDSFGPDVEGPLAAGMQAVHLWRPEDRVGARAPERDDGVPPIASLLELLDALGAPRATSRRRRNR